MAFILFLLFILNVFFFFSFLFSVFLKRCIQSYKYSTSQQYAVCIPSVNAVLKFECEADNENNLPKLKPMMMTSMIDKWQREITIDETAEIKIKIKKT